MNLVNMIEMGEKGSDATKYELNIVYRNYFKGYLYLMAFVIPLIIFLYAFFLSKKFVLENWLVNIFVIFVFYIMIFGFILFLDTEIIPSFRKKELKISKEEIEFLISDEVEFKEKWENISKISTSMIKRTPSLIITRKKIGKEVTIRKFVVSIRIIESHDKAKNLIFDNEMMSKKMLIDIFLKLKEICKIKDIILVDELNWERRMNNKIIFSLT